MNYNLIAWNYNCPMNAAAYHKWNRLILLWLMTMSLILLRTLVPLFISACHSCANRSQMASSADWVALSVCLPCLVLRDRSIRCLNQVTLVLASLFQWTSPHFRNLPLCPASRLPLTSQHHSLHRQHLLLWLLLHSWALIFVFIFFHLFEFSPKGREIS